MSIENLKTRLEAIEAITTEQLVERIKTLPDYLDLQEKIAVAVFAKLNPPISTKTLAQAIYDNPFTFEFDNAVKRLKESYERIMQERELTRSKNDKPRT